MAMTQLKNQLSWLCRLCPGCRSQGSVQYRGEASRNSTSGRLRRRITASRKSARRSPMLEPTERKTFAIDALVPALIYSALASPLICSALASGLRPSARTATTTHKLDPGDALQPLHGRGQLPHADAHLATRELAEQHAGQPSRQPLQQVDALLGRLFDDPRRHETIVHRGLEVVGGGRRGQVHA